mgnify:FL=1
MPIDPRIGERRSEYMSRCISTEVEAGYSQDQATAICASKWDEARGNAAFFAANLAGPGARRNWLGAEYAVYPAILAIAEVDMNGLCIPADEFHPGSWNGVPVTRGHPTTPGGDPDTANTPEFIASNCVGRVFNVYVDSEQKLRGELWVDTNSVTADELNALDDAGVPVDVSTGYFAAADSAGYYHNIRPDHLAVLFDAPGACSWRDGCGVRANESNEEGIFMKALEKFKSLFTNSATACKDAKDATAEAARALFANAAMGETLDVIQRKLDGMDSRGMLHFLIEAFDDGTFVYVISYAETEDRRLFRDTYTLDDVGNVAFGGEPVEVYREVSYTPVNSTTSDNTEEEVSMNETDPKVAGAEAEGNEDEALNANSAPALNAEDREALEFARNAYREHREKLIEKIEQNSDITRDAAEAMETNTLETVANGLRPQANYAGAGAGPAAAPTANAGDEAKVALEAMSTPSTADMLGNQ